MNARGPTGVPAPPADPQQPTFEELAGRWQAGDALALEALDERLRPAIRAALARLLRRPLPDLLTPDDVRQQAWVVLAEIAARWRPTGSFLAYFTRTFERELRRSVLRARPSRSGRPVRVLMVPHDVLLAAIEHVPISDNSPEGAALLRDRLAPLTDTERTAVTLHLFEEQDFAAIGRRLNVSRATAHRIYRRGLARLAEILRSDGRRPSSSAALNGR